MKTFKQVREDIGAAMSAGSGQIAGLGVGPEGEPGVHLGNKKKKNPVILPLMTRQK